MKRRKLGSDLQLTGHIDLKAADGDPKRFEILAYTGGKLHVDGFDLPVVVDLDGLEASGEVPIAIKHDLSDDMILGQTDPNGIKNDGKTLSLSGNITADSADSANVRRVFKMSKRGHKWQASIGAKVREKRTIAAGQTVFVNGRNQSGPFIHAIRSVLRETSVLGMGADKNTRVLLAQKRKGLKMNEFDKWLTEECGFTELDKMDATVKAKLNVQFDLIQAVNAERAEHEEADDSEEDADDVEAEGETDIEAEEESEADDEINVATKKKAAKKKVKTDINAAGDLDILAKRKAYAAELRRCNAIEAKCGKDKILTAKAIGNGWSVEKAELEFLRRQQRKSPPAGHRSGSRGGITLQALQGGMLLRAGGRIDNEAFSGELGLALNLPQWLRAGVNDDQRQQAMEAAWKFRDWSMVDLCRAACQIDGIETDGSNTGYIRAAVSGGSLADIFTTSINATMIQKLMEHGDTTAGWTREADANNFQTMDRIRLVKGPKLTPHRRTGTADHASRSDQYESYRIARYSQQFAVDEQDMIDDRFNALADIPVEMALACSRLRPDLVYYILMSNPTLTATSTALFSASQPAGTVGGAAQSNLATGAALSMDTLAAGMTTLYNFLENGVGVGQSATHLIVPKGKAPLAYSLLQSQNQVIRGSTDTQFGEINPLKALQADDGSVQVISDQRLTNGVTDPVTGTVQAGSSTTWRLVSNKVPTIEVAYLRGSGRAPQVRQYTLDKGQWGIGWDVNMDIGAKAMEWRGMYEGRA